MKKIVSIVAIALMTFSAAFAQENNNRDENGNIVRGPYETNSFGDNWFFGVGAGANAILNANNNFGFGGLAADVFLGKWFTPTVGARVGYKGIKDSFDPKSGYTTTVGNGSGNFNQQHYVHGDLMWNILNTISGYKETRVWDIIPYASTGWVRMNYTSGKNRVHDNEWGLGAGIFNNFRLGDRISLFVDLGVVSIRGAVIPTYKGNVLDSKTYSYLPSATAGLKFNIGRTNWDRHSSITPVPVVLPFTEAQYNALKDANARLEADKKALAAELEAARNAAPDTVYVKAGNLKAAFYFDLGKSVLSPKELNHLADFAEQLAKGEKVTVTGSADSGTGSKAINEKLASKRAKYVTDQLVKCGLSSDDITVETVFDIFGNNKKSRCAVVEQ